MQFVDRRFDGRSRSSTGLSANAGLCRTGDRLNLCARAFRETAATGFGAVTRVYGGGVDGSYRLNETDYLRARADYSNADGQGVLGGLGVNILTTPRGLMTGRDARKENVGGELICQIW